MNRIFDLKKPKKHSFFDKATIVIDKYRGKGKARKILLDYNFFNALDAHDKDLKIGFILGKDAYLVNIETIDSKLQDFMNEDVNKNLYSVSKNYNINVRFDEGKYVSKFKSINNKILWEALSDNFELNNEHIVKYTLSIVDVKNDPYLEQEIKDILIPLGITLIWRFTNEKSFNEDLFGNLEETNNIIEISNEYGVSRHSLFSNKYIPTKIKAIKAGRLNSAEMDEMRIAMDNAMNKMNEEWGLTTSTPIPKTSFNTTIDEELKSSKSQF